MTDQPTLTELVQQKLGEMKADASDQIANKEKTFLETGHELNRLEKEYEKELDQEVAKFKRNLASKANSLARRYKQQAKMIAESNGFKTRVFTGSTKVEEFRINKLRAIDSVKR